MSIVEACYAFGAILIASELGQRATSSFAVISDAWIQFNWNLFSLEVNRFLLIILPTVHTPVAIKCFGSVSCDRDSFKKVEYYYYYCAMNEYRK